MQAEAEAAGACATAEGLAQVRRELVGQVERACLEQRRAERKRDAALSQADALRLRSSSLSLLALPPTNLYDAEVGSKQAAGFFRATPGAKGFLTSSIPPDAALNLWQKT